MNTHTNLLVLCERVCIYLCCNNWCAHTINCKFFYNILVAGYMGDWSMCVCVYIYVCVCIFADGKCLSTFVSFRKWNSTEIGLRSVKVLFDLFVLLVVGFSCGCCCCCWCWCVFLSLCCLSQLHYKTQMYATMWCEMIYHFFSQSEQRDLLFCAWMFTQLYAYMKIHESPNPINFIINMHTKYVNCVCAFFFQFISFSTCHTFELRFAFNEYRYVCCCWLVFFRLLFRVPVFEFF